MLRSDSTICNYCIHQRVAGLRIKKEAPNISHNIAMLKIGFLPQLWKHSEIPTVLL